MLSRLLRMLRRAMIETVATLTLLMTAALAGSAQSNLGWHDEYRDCRLGSQQRFDLCVDDNNWGANFVFVKKSSAFYFPDRDSVTLMVNGIESY